MSDDVYFTPTWTAEGRFPQLGDGTLTGTCNFTEAWARILLRPGNDTTYGTGAWLFGDPLGNPALGGTGLATRARVSWTLIVVRRGDALTVCTSDGRPVSAGHPFRWGAGDSLQVMLGHVPDRSAI